MSDIDLVEKYRQQYAHFGRMNDILYKLPVLFSTLIGGLWYFAFSFMDKNTFVFLVVHLFAAGLSVVFYFIIERFRLAFNAYIHNINKMDGEMQISISSSIPSTMRLIQYSLVLAGTISVLSVCYILLN